MSEKKEQEVKKVRRGVSNQTQAVNQLRFHEKDVTKFGIFMAELADVKVEYSNNPDAKQFAGISIPRLTFEFTSTHDKAIEKRHAYYTLFPVESTVNTIPNGSEEWKVNQVLNGIKHILDVFYFKGRLMTEAEEDMLALNFTDFDDEGNYVPVDPQVVADGYGVLFKNVVAMMNGLTVAKEGETPKAFYKDKDGKPVKCWIKLLRYKKAKGEWRAINNGELAFDPFIGNGFVELVNGNNPPAILRLDLSRESITPKDVKKAPNMPGIGAGVMVGDSMAPGIPSDMGAYAAAGDDLPF